MSDFYNKYPYTDFHELNLDWVIERVKKLTEDWAATLEEWNSTEEQWQQLYDYVHDYFDNLDVQQEINNKINAMIADGTFVTITTPVIEAKVASMMPATVAAQIGDTVAGQIGNTVAGQLPGVVSDQIGAAVVNPVNDWLDANITQPTTPVVDKSLTIGDAAADAETTGTYISGIGQALSFDANSSIVSFNGYYIADGSMAYNASINGKATSIIPCKAGDTFGYKGRGESLAVSVLYYDGNTVLSSEQHVSESNFYLITIPAGANGVRFCSYSTGTCVLEVAKHHGYNDIYEKNVNVRINNLQNDKIPDGIYINATGTVISGSYLWYGYNGAKWYGEVAIAGSKCSDFIPVIPGETVQINAKGSYYGVAYMVFDIYKNPIYVYPETYVSGDTQVNFAEYTIPDNGYFIRISSIDSHLLSLERKDAYISRDMIDILTRDALADEWESVTLENTTNDYIARDGSTISYASSKLSDYEAVDPGSYIRVTGKCADGARLLAWYDSDLNQIALYPNRSVSSPTITAVDELIQVPFAASYVRISAVYSTTIGLKKRIPVKDLINSVANEGNVLANKKYIAVGDSFTHGDFAGLPDPYDSEIWDSATSQYKTYPWQIAHRNSMDFTNLAVNGSKLVDFVSNQDYLNIPADADYCTIMYGLNDYSASVPIGTASDATASTFCGAWNILLDWINNNRPNLKVGILIISAYLGNSYRTATETMAKKYGIPFLNFYTDDKVPIFMNKSGVDASIAQVKYSYYQVTVNNSHPNITCHKFESTFIENFMRGL